MIVSDVALAVRTARGTCGRRAPACRARRSSRGRAAAFGSFRRRRPASCRKRTPIFGCQTVQSRAAARTHDQSRSPMRSLHGRRPSANSRSRSLRCRSGSGILTGHTTPHWLHSVDACGRSSALLEADVHRRQDRADRAGIHPSVRMAADVLIDRAMVHAGAAADAAQRLADLAAQHVAAAAVDDDEIHALRAMEFAGALGRPSGRRRSWRSTAGRERGSRRISVATSSSVGTIFSMPEIATCTLGSVVVSVALPSLVTMHHGARLGDEEIAAGDAHVGGQVVFAQNAARLEAQLLDAVLHAACRASSRRARPPPPCSCAAPGR